MTATGGDIQPSDDSCFQALSIDAGISYDVEVRLELALSLIGSAQSCMMLDSDRKTISQPGTLQQPLRLPLEQAVREARPGFTPMALPAPDVLAIDFDDPESEARGAAFRFLLDHLRHQGYGPLVTASGRPGHRHLWCIANGQSDRDRLADLAIGIKLSVRVKQPIRLPLGPYYDDTGTVALVSPDSTEQALRAVRRDAPSPVARGVSIPAQRKARQPLGVKPAALLREGGTDDFSNADASIALAAVNAGWTYVEWRAEYLNPTNLGRGFADAPGVKGRGYLGREARQQGTGEAYLRKTWDSAVRWAAQHPAVASRHDAVVLLTAWRDEALHRPWPGATGPTDLALYIVMIGMGIQLGKTVLGIGRQDLYERMNRGHRTVDAAMRRLQDSGAAQLEQQGTLGLTSVWRLLPPPRPSVTEGSPISIPGGCETECPHSRTPLPITHDLFTAEGLDLTGWQLLSALCPDCPQTLAGLVARTGRSRSTLYKHMPQLVELGLAAEHGNGYVHAVSAQGLDAAAAILRVTGRSDQLAVAHVARRESRQRERSQREAAVEKVQAMRTLSGPHSEPGLG